MTLKDVGTRQAIEHWAREENAELTNLQLLSQFRCNGADGYIAWLDNLLGIRTTANVQLSTPDEFDFRVVDSPGELHDLIRERNRERNRARMVAGYCWDWSSKKNGKGTDIRIEPFGYAAQWNLTKDGSLWIVSPASVEQVGCIHTCQGLEVDYVGVIVGPDLVVRAGTVLARPEHRAPADRTIRGYKKLLRSSDPEAARSIDLVIKNTYRTLMTRGMKGCYVYCTDAETAAHFKAALRQGATKPSGQVSASAAKSRHVAARGATVIPFRRVPSGELRPYQNAVPLVDLKFAAGGFGRAQALDEDAIAWVELPEHLRPRPGFFVAQVIGESMNRQIPSGAWCLFRLDPQGTRVGKVVVAQHRSISDPEHGGSFTVKQYQSEKAQDSDGWRHSRIVLKPNSSDPRFEPIVLEASDADQLRIVAELVQVLALPAPPGAST